MNQPRNQPVNQPRNRPKNQPPNRPSASRRNRPESELYEVTENDGGKDVGSYTVTLKLVNADDYLWYDGSVVDSAEYICRWTITQAVYGTDYTVTNPVYDGEYVYDNTGKLPTQHAVITFNGGSQISGGDYYDPLIAPVRYAYAKVNSVDDIPQPADFVYDRPVAAGIYKVVAFVPATVNYTEGYNLEDIAVLIIQKADYDMSGISLADGEEFTFDGTAHSPLLEGTLPAGLDNVRAEIEGYVYALADGTAVEGAISAGTYTVTVTFRTTSPNYNVPQPISAQFVINARKLTSDDVHWESGEFTYNGTDQSASVKAYYLDAGGERVYLELSITSFTPAGGAGASTLSEQFVNAGTYVFTISSVDNPDYVFESAQTLTLVMAQSNITVQLGTIEGVYSGAEPTDVADIAVTVVGNYYDDDLGIAFAKQKGTSVGSYAVTIDGWNNYNYIITNAEYAVGTYKIVPKTLTVGISVNADLTYNNSSKDATWSIDAAQFVQGEGIGDVAVAFVYEGTANDGTTWHSTQAPVKAGNYTVRAVLTAANYDMASAEPVAFTIARAKVAMPTLADSGKQTVTSVETGEVQTVVLNGFDSRVMGVTSNALSGLVVDDKGNFSLTASAIGEYSVTVYLKDTDNYEWSDIEATEPGAPAVTDIALTWTVEEAIQSILWLIITLACLLAVEIVVLIVAVRRRKTADGPDDDGAPFEDDTVGGGSADEQPEEEATSEDNPEAQPENEDTSEGEPKDGSPKGGNKMYSFAPLGLLLAVPMGQIVAASVLGAACAVVGVCIIVALVRSRKRAEQQEETPEEQPAIVFEPIEQPVEEPVEEPAPAEEPVEEPEPLPAVVEEEIAAAEKEPEEEDDDDDDEPLSFEEEDIDVVIPEGTDGIRKIYIRYEFSFRARLIQASPEVKARYIEFINEEAAYEGLKSNISWKQERLYKGRNTAAYLLFKGKKLCVAFALDPKDYAETKYRGIDVSEVKRFARTPLLLKITSQRRLRYAKHLLADVCAKYGLKKGEVPKNDIISSTAPPKNLSPTSL